MSTVVNQAGDPTTLLSSATNAAFSQESKFPSQAVDDANQRVVRVFADKNNGNYGTAVCGQIDGTGNITWGTPVVFQSAYLDTNFVVVLNESTTEYFVFYKNPSTGEPRISRMSNTSGTNLTLVASYSNPGNYGSCSSEGFAGVYDPDQQRVVFVWYSTGQGSMAVATYAGGLQATTTFGVSNWSQYSDITYDTVNNKVVFVWMLNQNNTINAHVITVGASSVSVANLVNTGAIGGVMPRCTFDPDSGKVITASVRSSQGGVVNYGLGTVSGTTSSWTTGASTAVDADDLEAGYDLTYDTGADKVVFSYKAVGNPQRVKAVLGTVSGSTLTFSSTAVEIYPAYARYSRVDYLPTSGYSVWTASASNNNETLASAVTTVVASTYSSWFGIADASISSGSAGKITHIGGINESVSGLTAGTTHVLRR